MTRVIAVTVGQSGGTCRNVQAWHLRVMERLTSVTVVVTGGTEI